MRFSVVPFYSSQLRNFFFDDAHSANRDGALEPFVEIKTYAEEKGISISTVDIISIEEADRIIFFGLPINHLIRAYLKGKLKDSIYIPFEPPVVRPLHRPENLKVIARAFGQVLTWQDDLVGTQNFKKFYFPMPDLRGQVQRKGFENKKLITTVVGFKQSSAPNELYSHRIEAIRYLEKRYPESFRFYGVGWDPDEYPSYSGAVENKLETLSEYKFAICYENECNINGLISEKIFDCFYAGVIPVFWGAGNVEKYIPADCYIDRRDFHSYESLCNYMENMSVSEHDKRIMAIDEYLLSFEYERHLSGSFAKNVNEVLFSDKDLAVSKIAFLKLIALILKYKVIAASKKIAPVFNKFIK